MLVLLAATSAQAQITIGGNVYGGGNEGDVGGNTTVTVHAGDLNEVYGGARLADVGGRAFVNIDGAHASDNIIITSVYGGNDIAGTIGSGDALPEELTDVPKANDTEETLATKNAIDNTWNAFIRTSPTPSTTTSIVVGSMFGGGNGDYSYTANAEVEGTYNVTIGDKTYTKIYKPELGKTYLEIKGGCIAHLYGGGDNVTVTSNTTICIDNNSPVLDHTNVWTTDPTELAKLAKRMQMSTFQSNLTSYAFNFARVFGGNNKAPMAIRPTWNLKNGTIRDLYSGGNAGAMTYEQGILLVINSDGMNIDNVYGGCRMADVNPDKNDMPKLDGTFNGIECHFPAGYAARLLIAAGNINNVYGGNDISGTVYGGNAVGIRTNVNGDIYGGGNGSYAYTDNKDLKGDPIYGDFYYDVNKILGNAEDHVFTGMESVRALNEFRPNAERVSLRLLGKEDNPTIIHGSVYCGGNSATLKNKTAGATASAELKIGSYVIADHVFLGSNGENLIEPDLLKLYKGSVSGYDFSQMDLASEEKENGKTTQFDEYMDAVSISTKPIVVFDTAADGQAYVPYSTKIGSFYCGGNVGSVKTEGVVDIDFAHEVIIFDKLVGGCNNANVDKQFDGEITLNAAYEGGVLGSATNGNKLILNLSGLKLQPKRWNSDKTDLVWNTVSAKTGNEVEPVTDDAVAFDKNTDLDRRLKGGNIYGGCYNSGHVDGNVVININETLVERDKVFDVASDEGETLYDNVERGTYQITKRNSGVILSQQGMDVLGSALNVFGGGFGAPSEIWGSTTINLNKGYTFQIFGGGEQGAIGKKDADGKYGIKKNDGTYGPDENYSTYINLNGETNLPGVARGAAGDSPDMAECEFIYGGAFEGLIAGSTHINLGNGRIFNTFAGSCNADILGHTETFVGRKKNTDGTYEDGGGFPWIRDHIYGGNDLGGSILGEADFTSRIREDVNSMVADAYKAQVAKATAYIEYTQGRVRNILGGCFGDYDYSLAEYSVKENADDEDYKVANKPYLHSAFVNFRPNTKANNAVEKIFGAGEGFSGDRDGDKSQDHSYVLIDIPDNMEKFANTEIFGAGAYNGLGMRYRAADTFESNFDRNEASAIIDLMRGKVGAAYGGSYEEGITRRTVVNVPVKGSKKSTIKINNIFGGAYGMKILPPCDVYEANVNYQSGDARVNGAIYGGNNNVRRTLYGKVNISAPVLKDNGNSAKVYGAGRGQYTWSEYTEVNLESGANVWEVYGGGELGNVLNAESVQKYLQLYRYQPALMVANEDEFWGNPDKWVSGKVGGTLLEDYRNLWLETWKDAWTLGDYYDPVGEFTRYVANPYTNLSNPLVTEAVMDDRDLSGFSEEQKARTLKRYNTNVIIQEGATVGNYAYGGGYGSATIPLTGGVYGSSYIALLGGTVTKDIYAAGTTGSVCDIFGAANDNQMRFVASANAYVKGGTVRNVYGGGWRGSVGYHSGAIGNVANNTSDLDGEVHVIVGDQDGTTITAGIPSITRNVYGGGEGGAIYGDAYVKINKGYIGYRYNSTVADNTQTEDFDERYVPELDDEEVGDNKLDQGGNVFGGGYVANSYVDRSHVTMLGGTVRGSLYGGGEIGPIGRGTVHADSIAKYRALYPDYIKNGVAIYKGGETHVDLWDGHVMRDVFGGGRGYDNWGGEGYMTDEEKETMDKSSKGYVFGSTDVHIYGGEIGTEANVLKGYGNVFGGGNEGFVYSATGEKGSDGYYRNGSSLSEDCKIAVEPQCKVTDAGGITIDGTTYAKGTYVPLEALNKLQSRTHTSEWAKLDTRGIVIHNALFAGGNITEGSDKIFANTVTVYGNAAASLRDVYNFDLISLGTEEMGGLYGDGNLTLVDGFRELHIDNYGTDYYSLAKTLTINQYKELTTRQQAYYKLKYAAKSDHTYEYYESNMLHTYKYTDDEGSHEVSYRKGEKIPRPSTTYDSFTDKEKENWTQGSRTYSTDEQIEEGEYSLMDGTDSEYENQKTGEKAKWKLLGVTSIYAGRPMNTIQRADFCGVFGSRMVMKGAVDRAPQVNGGVDYNSYTINRVEEVSLNSRTTTADDTSDEDKEHGNYFGIYNSVKFLGNLTSDVAFTDVRKTDTNNTDLQANGTITYYDWKAAKPQWKYRNNGISHNKVALASGVYLELKKEETESAGRDVWGYITGVVELDLINVMPGMGGGYVYAKNEHGTRSKVDSYNKVSLLNYNATASTYRQFTYGSTGTEAIETSGNFVHNTKQIVDDCYPNGGIYNDHYVASPAHYWFIRGSIYVYDQYISAYTGSANAMAEKQEIPLNITAASNGRMTLRDVQPNYYAYYDKGGNKLGSENADSVFVVNNVSYKLNQAISNWDYNLLSEGDKAKFVDKTYLVVEDCKIGTTEYKKGTVMLYDQYNSLKNSTTTVKYMEGDVEKDDGKFDYFFRLSNNLGHDTGYLLTYDVNNPMVWNNYYTLTANPGQANALNTKEYDALTSGKGNYTEGPTYTLKGNSNGVFGQQDYTLGSIIYGSAKTAYDANVYSHLSEASKALQAEVEQAWVVTKEHSVKNENGEEIQSLSVGTPIYQSKYTAAQWNAITSAGAAEVAKVCTSLLEFSSTDYVWAGKVLSSADIAEIKTKIKGKNTSWSDDQVNTYLNSYLDDAYYCKKAGKYGGIYFESGKAYRALDTWCSMTAEERANFTFNYDALDLLIDPNFGYAYGSKYQYDGYNEDGTTKLSDKALDSKLYSVGQPIDYQAEFVGYQEEEGGSVVTLITYQPNSGAAVTINKSTSQSDWLSREEYESIPNEKRHYSPIIITAPGTYYMVRNTFMDGEVPYTTGQQIEEETFNALGSIKQANIDKFTFVAPTGTEADKNKAVTNPQTTDSEGNKVYDPKTYYYCRDAYTIDEKGEGKDVTTTEVNKNGSVVSSVTYKKANAEVEGSTDEQVPQGVVINETTYDGLCNFQKGFVVHGTSPTEVSTLYVSNESDINDLSAEKIITVIYLYEYDESDESGLNVTPVSERHILNIHINFKSGVPEIGDITKPDIVLPGTTIGMTIPSVTQGAYRITESGWEIFSNDDDAATHYNGTPFYNNETPLYWYQNNYWIAYYAQTSLGKTYSKSVKLNVANYHDLKKVMDDKEHHYYIDHKDVDRQPKIYINDYSASGENGLDLFKDLINLSYGHLDGHAPLENHTAKQMKGGKYLEFFLHTDLSHPDTNAANEWTSIANGTNECFEGNFHGEGHTISGLDNSLFGHLCGNVFNLGVQGSFTGAGIAETGDGYVENCWTSTSSTATKTSKPVFGTPTGSDETRPYRIVNCYYQEDDNATTTSKYTNHNSTSGYGVPTRKDSRAFYNGEVAFDLNGFYLYKRYCDKKVTSGGLTYNYYTINADKTLTLHNANNAGHYGGDAILCSAPYVETRYEDGDFRFADGSIPISEDKRHYTVKDQNDNDVDMYAPIWPDDYIFFGQALTYDYTGVHQNYPSTINKRDGLIVDGTGSNHVHRAPAYFGSKAMGVAHFNPVVTLAAYSKPPTETSTDVKEAYPGMTAIDFAGHGDTEYKLGLNGDFFYQPLLDDGGLYSIENADETHNLLVYAPTEAANKATYGVLNRYFTEPAYSTYATIDTYGSVGIAPSTVFGHVVQNDLTTTTDHLLVDKEDFNCPISYTMGTGKRMWYQRTPDKFVNIESGNTKGWDNISLPFKVSYVATQQKGEITHFYNYKNGDEDNTTGHEYWLRQFAGNFRETSTTGVYAADFNLLAPTGENKAYSNKFLWDYYYSKNGSDDANGDDYKQYYNIGHTYTSYPLEQAGGAYLIGFPGKSYYEFDLSGEWTAANTASPAPGKLDKQTITFASDPAITIAISDDEIHAGKTVKDNYAYVANYVSKKFTDAGACYVLADDGASYVKNTANAIVTAFRPYIVEASNAPARGKDNPEVEQVVFGMDQDTDFLPHDDIIDRLDGTLNIYAKKGKIVVESSLRYTVDVSIYTPAGIAMYKFPVKAGETVEQRINSKGVYIVHSDDGQHMKKVIVR